MKRMANWRWILMVSLLVGIYLLPNCGGGGGGSSPSPSLSSITVTPANPSIPAGNTKQFAATGTYSNGTSQDITT